MLISWACMCEIVCECSVNFSCFDFFPSSVCECVFPHAKNQHSVSEHAIYCDKIGEASSSSTGVLDNMLSIHDNT